MPSTFAPSFFKRRGSQSFPAKIKDKISRVTRSRAQDQACASAPLDKEQSQPLPRPCVNDKIKAAFARTAATFRHLASKVTMPRALHNPDGKRDLPEVIDLISDGDDGYETASENEDLYGASSEALPIQRGENREKDLDRVSQNVNAEEYAGPAEEVAGAQEPDNNIHGAPEEDDAAVPVESLDHCIVMTAFLFPGICSRHLLDVFEEGYNTSERMIQHILDGVEKGASYPKAKDRKEKRKREVDEDQELIDKYDGADRMMQPAYDGVSRSFICKLLSVEFPFVPMWYVHYTLNDNGYRLSPTYTILEEAERTYNPETSPYQRIKHARKKEIRYSDLDVAAEEAVKTGEPYKVEALKVLGACRRFRDKAKAKRQAEQDAETAEMENTARSKAEGAMAECGCCYDRFPLNRMVHCDGDIMHWFCKVCARQSAEEEVGKSKYQLDCMSIEETCTAGFSEDQRALFLDKKIQVALERNEQESNLRLAGIDNLESCPFCPYAAEYPPIEIDREFRCQAPECERISCRLCRMESHIPKSCAEYAKENGLTVRRRIEEAMSEALIRKCNKCGTPFIKEDGCNKMTCTRNGCYNIQCYVCSKSCAYDHFNDQSRGGKIGNCPLFENVETRHEGEVSKAEKEALTTVLAEHPEYTEEDLKLKWSTNVAADDANRRLRVPR